MVGQGQVSLHFGKVCVGDDWHGVHLPVDHAGLQPRIYFTPSQRISLAVQGVDNDLMRRDRHGANAHAVEILNTRD